MSKKSRKEIGKMIISRSSLALLIIGVFLAGSLTSFGIQQAMKNISSREVLSTENTRKASTKIVATDTQGNGVTADLTVKISPGEGEVFYRIKPLAKVDLQYSANTALEVASRVAQVSLGSNDVAFTIDAGNAKIVGGPSAGAAMTVTALAAIRNRKVKDNVVITGEIRGDGTIGQVGGILAKAGAAAQSGKDLFLVPNGQSTVISYREVTKQYGPFEFTEYEPYKVELNSYAENRNWDLRVKEVSDIQKAAEMMLSEDNNANSEDL